MNSTVSTPLPPLMVTSVAPEIVKLCDSPRLECRIGSSSVTVIVPAAPGATFIRSLFRSRELSAPLMTTVGDEMVTGSRPAYMIVRPSTISVPECGSVGFDTTLAPDTCTVSKPPGPPSMTPETPAPGSTTKVSLLPAAPARFSKPAKEMPATEPEPSPEIVQVESAAGPWSVSEPAPPFSATGTGRAPADTSKESSPAPPVTVRLVTAATGRLDATPSTVTTSASAVTAIETVCEASDSETFHAAGGEGPLPGVAAGSGGGVVTPVESVPSEPAGAGVVVEPPEAPVWPLLVPAPPPEPEPVPATGDEPFCDCDAGSPEVAPTDGEVPETCGGVEAAPVTPFVSIVVVVSGVFTWRDGDDGSGTETVVSVGSSWGAGPESMAAPEPAEIVPEPPELIVCCDEPSEPGAAGGSCGVVPSELPWALCSERDGAAGACC